MTVHDGLLYFAKRAKEHGWTKGETWNVIDATQKEVIRQINRCGRADLLKILKKYSLPIVEAKEKLKKC